MIYMIGIDHTKASLDARSVFSFTKEAMREALEEMKEAWNAHGIVILATCNRTEIWLSLSERVEESDLIKTLCKVKQVSPEDYSGLFVVRKDRTAVSHLFYVACGLKSAIMAEDQIISQVKDALSFARSWYMTDSALEVLFRMAVTAAKQVKTEVHFSRRDASAMDGVLRYLQKQERIRRCLVIGNGEMGKLAASSLEAAGYDTTVTVRQYHSGQVQIPQGCHRINYGERFDFLAECDFVLSATASPHCTIEKKDLERISHKDRMIFVDLAVPRDIDPEIRELDGIELHDIDEFRNHIEPSHTESYRKAADILEKQIEEYFTWKESRTVVPRIKKIQEAAAKDLSWRLTRPMKKAFAEEEKRAEFDRQMESSTEKVVARMLYIMRDHMDPDTFRNCLDALEERMER
jgi:glutamyl-tRNA reductase